MNPMLCFVLVVLHKVTQIWLWDSRASISRPKKSGSMVVKLNVKKKNILGKHGYNYSYYMLFMMVCIIYNIMGMNTGY